MHYNSKRRSLCTEYTPFGYTTALYKWCVFYKTLNDISNDLTDNDFWDSNKLLSHDQLKFPPKIRTTLSEKYKSPKVEIVSALISGLEKNPARIDGYIDKVTSPELDERDWVQCASY